MQEKLLDLLISRGQLPTIDEQIVMVGTIDDCKYMDELVALGLAIRVDTFAPTLLNSSYSYVSIDTITKRTII
jgi:hypothetical protein